MPNLHHLEFQQEWLLEFLLHHLHPQLVQLQYQ
jgi:hypothetical protein